MGGKYGQVEDIYLVSASQMDGRSEIRLEEEARRHKRDGEAEETARDGNVGGVLGRGRSGGDGDGGGGRCGSGAGCE